MVATPHHTTAMEVTTQATVMILTPTPTKTATVHIMLFQPMATHTIQLTTLTTPTTLLHMTCHMITQTQLQIVQVLMETT